MLLIQVLIRSLKGPCKILVRSLESVFLSRTRCARGPPPPAELEDDVCRRACAIVAKFYRMTWEGDFLTTFFRSGRRSGRRVCTSWDALGAILRRSWGHLGRSGGLLGASWAILGPLGAFLAPSWGDLGASWGDLGVLLGDFGATLRPLGDVLGDHGASGGVLGVVLGDLGAILKPLGAILEPLGAILRRS